MALRMPSSVLGDISSLTPVHPVMRYLMLAAKHNDHQRSDVTMDYLRPQLVRMVQAKDTQDEPHNPTTNLIYTLATRSLEDSYGLTAHNCFVNDLRDIALAYSDALKDCGATPDDHVPDCFQNLAFETRGTPWSHQTMPPHDLFTKLTADNATDNTSSCGYCHSRQPNLRACLGCKIESSAGLHTVYCGKLCQRKDRKAHKVICGHVRDAIMLKRAVGILRALYYLMRSRAYELSLTKVERRSGLLYAHPMTDSEQVREALKRVFPTRRFDDSWCESEADKEAILSYRQCNKFLIYMMPVTQKLLEGFDNLHLEEVLVGVKRVQRATAFVEEDGTKIYNTRFGHHVLKATTESKAAFSIDITGAQFGWPESISKWSVFQNERAQMFPTQQPFGTCFQEELRTTLKHTTQRDEGYFSWSMQSNFAYAIKHALVSWLAQENLTLAKLYELEESSFQDKSESLLAYVRDDLERTMRTFEDKKQWWYSLKKGCPTLTGRDDLGICNLQEMCDDAAAAGVPVV